MNSLSGLYVGLQSRPDLLLRQLRRGSSRSEPLQAVSACKGLMSQAPWAEVSHQVGGYPVDGACIDVSHLEQRRNIGVPGTTINPNHISQPPGAFRVSDDHGRARFDMQENGIRLGRCNGPRMFN